MTTKFRILALALMVALFSVQCTNNDSETPDYPTSIESHFKSGSFSYDNINIAYRDGSTLSSSAGRAALVVVLHGQYSSGSDNISQLRSDAMIRIWHHLYTSNTNAVILAPQCSARRQWDETEKDVKGTTMPQALKALIDNYVANKSNIDPSKVYLVGYSDGAQPAGGGAVWHMLSDYTDLFAAGMSVAADPDETIVAANIAKTPVLSVKGESDVHAVALTLDSFGDQVRDAGGELKEIVLNVRSREDVCREAFTVENLSWLLQFTK